MIQWRRLQSMFCFPSFSSFPNLTYSQVKESLRKTLSTSYVMFNLYRIKEPEIYELTVGATILLIRWIDGSRRVLKERVHLVSYDTT